MFFLLSCFQFQIETIADSGDAGDSGGFTTDSTSAETGDTDTPPTQLSAVSARLNELVPSVFYVGWTQSEQASAKVEYSVDEGIWLSTPDISREAGTHEQIVLGVPFAAPVQYRVTLAAGDSSVSSTEATITTGPLPDGVPVARAVSGDEALWDVGATFVYIGMSGEGEEFDGDWWTMVVDRAGRVVWALPTPYGFVSLHPRVAPDGKAFLVDYNSYWGQFDGGTRSQVARTRIDGVVEQVWDTPGLHHAFTQLPDGAMAWGAMSRGDERLEVLGPDGVLSTLWNCGAFLEGLGEQAICGSNTLYYDEQTDHFLFSFYSVDAVIEVDRVTGETVRWFGDVPGSWTFDPPETQFWWQHGPSLTAKGNLLISTHMTEKGGEATVVREYQFDDGSETLREVWSFGTVEDDWVYGDQMGEAWRLDGGNTLHNYGTNPLLRESTPDGTVAWKMSWERGYTLGRSTPIADIYALAP